MREMAAIEALKSEKADKEVKRNYFGWHLVLLLTLFFSSEISNN
jgi:nitrogen fixation protein FixH